MRQQSRLRNQIHGLIILHFHICNLLRNLYQPTKYHIICFLSYLKVSPHLWWYNSRALFLSKWSRTQACPPFNMHWFRCTDSLRKFCRCSQKLTDCYRHYPKISLSDIKIDILWRKTYLVISPTVLVSNLCITT